jgi:hypothetical protein
VAPGRTLAAWGPSGLGGIELDDQGSLLKCARFS